MSWLDSTIYDILFDSGVHEHRSCLFRCHFDHTPVHASINPRMTGDLGSFSWIKWSGALLHFRRTNSGSWPDFYFCRNLSNNSIYLNYNQSRLYACLIQKLHETCEECCQENCKLIGTFLWLETVRREGKKVKHVIVYFVVCETSGAYCRRSFLLIGIFCCCWPFFIPAFPNVKLFTWFFLDINEQLTQCPPLLNL